MINCVFRLPSRLIAFIGVLLALILGTLSLSFWAVGYVILYFSDSKFRRLEQIKVKERA